MMEENARNDTISYFISKKSINAAKKVARAEAGNGANAAKKGTYVEAANGANAAKKISRAEAGNCVLEKKVRRDVHKNIDDSDERNKADINAHSGAGIDTRNDADIEARNSGTQAASLGSRIAKKLMAVNIIVASLIIIYFVVVFTDVPLVSEARDLWIETAMTTAEHHWLATRFFPRWLIDEVMSKQIVTDEDTLSDPNLLLSNASKNSTTGQYAGAAGNTGIATGQIIDNAESTGGSEGAGGDAQRIDKPRTRYGAAQGSSDGTGAALSIGAWLSEMGFFNRADYYEDDGFPRIGDVDEFGNTVIISDREEELFAVEVRKTGYTGRILFVPDPSRVVVRNTASKNNQGEFIKSYLNKYDAVAGVNGNGFDDPEGHGKGGVIIGWSVSNGDSWGYGAKSAYASVGFTDQDVLIVGTIKDFKAHNIRDLAQYGPTIIADGKKKISGSGGWGVQPRTAIGQREDGTILMATFDGRQPGHSLGITAGEVADILFDYGCVNAGLCDGGSSSIMMYDGQVVGKPSTPMKDTGRYLPNAILVLRKPPEQAAAISGEVAEAAPGGHIDSDSPKGRSTEM